LLRSHWVSIEVESHLLLLLIHHLLLLQLHLLHHKELLLLLLIHHHWIISHHHGVKPSPKLLLVKVVESIRHSWIVETSHKWIALGSIKTGLEIVPLETSLELLLLLLRRSHLRLWRWLLGGVKRLKLVHIALLLNQVGPWAWY
jgi:hypothetical protein